MTDTTTQAAIAPLVLHLALLEQIARHGEATYPEECCGILLGRDENGVRVVAQLIPIENQWSDGGRGNRFLIGPADVLKAERAARREGLDVLGFYHSHPDSAARPSEFDREHAWPWYTYLISSVRRGRHQTLTSWQLRDDRSGYDQVRIQQELHLLPDELTSRSFK